MVIGKAYVVILTMLCYTRVIVGENHPIPDAPSALLSAHAVSGVPSSDSAASPTSHRGRMINRQFLILSTISTSAIFADSYTTTWIGNNYRSRGPGGPCTVEGGEPQLYGLHPTAGRAYAIAGIMSGGAIAVSFLAKKYLPSKVKWMWPGAFLYETSISIHGFSTNQSRC